jgi:hypothetical protein
VRKRATIYFARSIVMTVTEYCANPADFLTNFSRPVRDLLRISAESFNWLAHSMWIAMPRGSAASNKGPHMRILNAVFAAVVLTFGASGAFANDADFKLKNKTGYQIDEVYVSAHSSNNWGKDIMGKDALADDEVLNVTFPHGGSACHFDIKVKYHDDDSTAEWGNVDLCQYETISLYWNAKLQETKAVGE